MKTSVALPGTEGGILKFCRAVVVMSTRPMTVNGRGFHSALLYPHILLNEVLSCATYNSIASHCLSSIAVHVHRRAAHSASNMQILFAPISLSLSSLWIFRKNSALSDVLICSRPLYSALRGHIMYSRCLLDSRTSLTLGAHAQRGLR